MSADASAWPTNVVWGETSKGHSVTWGPGFIKTQNVVWGIAMRRQRLPPRLERADSGDAVIDATDGDTVVWGTSDGDTVVWGTTCGDPSCEPVIWKRP